ncbi:hypothetical protein MFRU_003g04750 [Monilinia fructicola]|uniref:Uncharacterized protein n=1 Tax=Monilinia fructicola TaxID=38448 RepID=A0A5M9JS11_MONFR|nr:hypothetical protein EYC84_002924 [Monilinia fructicola]KAG4034515.1 hypothetical protein MFRU_003g04750 [Monilinia fructicola]
MGKSDLIPQTPPKRRVRPISNPLYSSDETFFCNTIKHNYLRPGEQFPDFARQCPVSFEHEARFYVECQAFYIFTLEFMNPVEPKKPTEDVLSPREVLIRPKSYRKPAKYDIRPLPQIDESSECSESFGEKGKNVGSSSPTQITTGYDIDHDKYGRSSSMASSLPKAVPLTNELHSFGSTLHPLPSSSPMLQMVHSVGNSLPSISSISPFNKSIDASRRTSEIPITKIASIVHDGADSISIHSTSADPLIKELDKIILTSRFPNLVYDAQSDRYIKKQNTEMEGSSRLSADLQTDPVYTTAGGKKEEKGRWNRMLRRPEVATMKYTNSEGATGVRPLRMKPQIQPSGLYRDVKNALGNGDDEIVAKGHVRMASEPERIGSPRADQQIGRLGPGTEPIKRISRNPHANTARKLEDSPTFATQNFRRRKAGPIYLPAPNEKEDSSPSRPFMPVNTRSPAPKVYTVRSPPPTDRPYRHISQRPDGIARVDTLPNQDSNSQKGNSSLTGVDINSFVLPPTPIASPEVDLFSFASPSSTPAENPAVFPSYTLNLPQIFSTPSPIAPPKLPSATLAAPTTNLSSKTPPHHNSNQRRDTATSSIYSIYTPDSSPHNSAIITPTLSRIPSIPTPPNTPPTALFRSDTINTVSTVPSTPTQTGTYTHSRHNTYSTMASSVESNIASPIIGPLPLPNSSPCPKPSPFRSPPTTYSPPPKSTPHPSPTPRPTNPSQESIALTEHLVREGIYGGIVYDIGVPPSAPADQPPQPSASQLRRENKRAARELISSLRKREEAEKRERKMQERARKILARNVKIKTRKTRLAVRGKRGVLSYSKIGGFFRGLGRGVNVRWEEARRSWAGREFWRVWRARQVGGDVGGGYDFVCRGENGIEGECADGDWEDVRGIV